MTQEQVAERMGTTKSMVSKIERGTVMYSKGSLEAYADAINCEPADLIRRPPPSKENPPTIEDLFKQAPPEVRALVEQVLKRTGTHG